MRRTYLHLLVIGLLITSAGPAAAAGKGAGTSSPVQNRSQNQVEQREMYQHREHSRDGLHALLNDVALAQGLFQGTIPSRLFCI